MHILENQIRMQNSATESQLIIIYIYELLIIYEIGGTMAGTCKT